MCTNPNQVDEGFYACTPASVDDLDPIVQLEQAVFPLPWSGKSFLEIIQQQGKRCGDYMVQLLWKQSQENAEKILCGYFVALLGVDEMHLLNLAVHPRFQRQGCAHRLLEHLRTCADSHNAEHLWLEVRQSNLRAQNVYSRFGFTPLSIRNNYYPSVDGAREHAVVMCLELKQSLQAS